jgi:hypothetical protein
MVSALFFWEMAVLKIVLESAVRKDWIVLPIHQLPDTPCSLAFGGQMAFITPVFFAIDTKMTSPERLFAAIILSSIKRKLI